MQHGIVTTWVLYLWHAFLSSKIYAAFAFAYRKITEAWHRSALIAPFRRYKEKEHTVESSVSHTIFYFPCFVLDKCKAWVRRVSEGSFLIRLMRILLHNALSLNVRFFGCLLSAFSAAYALALFALRHSAPHPLVWVALAVGLLLCLCNRNLMDDVKNSGLNRLTEHVLDCAISYHFYDTSVTDSSGRLVLSALLGAVGGVISVAASPLLGPAFICGIFGLLLLLFYPICGVVLTVFAAPILPTMAVAGLCIISLISLIVKSFADENFTWKVDGMCMLVIGLLLIYAVSGAAFSLSKPKSFQILIIYAIFMSFYFVIINTVRTKDALYAVLKAFVVGSLFVALYGFVQYLLGIEPENAWLDEQMFEDVKMRVYSTLENPNVLGEYLLLAIPMAVALFFIVKKKTAKWFFGLTSVALIACMILTQSRGCWIGMVLQAGLFITFLKGQLWGIAILFAAIAPFVLPSSITNRLTSIGNLEDSSSSYRRFIWLGSLAMLADYWFMGVGLGDPAFNVVYPMYEYNTVVAPHSHNVFLQVWLETGIAGFVAFGVLLVVFFLKMIQSYRAHDKHHPSSILSIALVSAVAGFLVQGMFDYSFYNYRVMLLFYVTLAIGMVVKTVALQEKPLPNTKPQEVLP